MYYYIYKTINNLNGKYYIGRRASESEPTTDPYKGSGVLIKKALALYGKDNFTKIILENCQSFEELLLAEARYVDNAVVNDTQSYNIDLGGRYTSRNNTTNELIS